MPVTIYLSLTSSPSAPRVPLTVDDPDGTTASDLRRRASELTSVPLASMKLIYRGKIIPEKDVGSVAADFALEEGCVVHVMGRPANDGASAQAASAGSARSSTATAGATVTTPANATGATATSSSPLKAALLKLKNSNDAAAYKTAVATADKLLGNIVSHVSCLSFAFHA